MIPLINRHEFQAALVAVSNKHPEALELVASIFKRMTKASNPQAESGRISWGFGEMMPGDMRVIKPEHLQQCRMALNMYKLRHKDVRMSLTKVEGAREYILECLAPLTPDVRTQLTKPLAPSALAGDFNE